MDSQSTPQPTIPPVASVAVPTTPSSERKRRCNKACIYCNRSHISCENVRPCSRCVSRGIAHLCQDAKTSKRGRKSYLNLESTPSTSCSVASLLNQEPLNPQLPTEIQYLLSDPLPSKKQTNSLQFTEMLTKKLTTTTSSESFLERFREARKKMEKHLEKFSTADLLQVQEADALEAQVWTKKFEQMFCNMTVPTFVYDRNGGIRYVNPAYKALTGFSLNPPLSEHSFQSCILAQSGLKDYFEVRFQLMENWCHLPPNGVMFKSSVRIYEKDGSGPEKSMEGTMAFNFKVDNLNIPFLILGFFLPSSVASPLILDFHHRVNL